MQVSLTNLHWWVDHMWLMHTHTYVITLLETGDRYRVNEFLAKHYKELKRKYKKLTAEEKQRLVFELTGLRQQRVHIVRSNLKSVQQDVNATFSAMDEEVC
jgi:hypothetical protein